MSTKKLRKNSKAAKVRVEIDRAWWYYYSEEPLPWEERPHGWPFGIHAEVKYFRGTYEEAEIEARKYAASIGTDVIYLKP